MFSGYTVSSDSKKEPRNCDQEASPSAGKNVGVALVAFHAWKCVPTTISSDVDFFEVSGCHLL